jgi:hypothetical protein
MPSLRSATRMKTRVQLPHPAFSGTRHSGENAGSGIFVTGSLWKLWCSGIGPVKT